MSKPRGAAEPQVRAVRRGQVVTAEVAGAFPRRPAPYDGLLVETDRTTILVPLEHVLRALKELESARAGDELRPPRPDVSRDR